jgi:class 3 adenylate cyclase
MQCKKCRFENPDGMLFCGKCGTKMESICPQCKSSNPFEFNFCGKCGSDLGKPQKAVSADYSEPQSYTPKHLADKILTTRSSIEGERKLVTVLFADVANFTSISEKLDPEEVHRLMDGCFKILMEEIHRFEGTINQFTGDGVMALFGAPVAHEDHGQRACRAALSIQSAMEKYGGQLKREIGIGFKMRIGLNSGPVVVGSIGDDLRMDYTAVGDTTNLASRMESTAEPGRIVLSSHTHKLVRDFFEFNDLGYIEVKGKQEFQEIFELLGTGDVDTRIAASMARGLTQFVGREDSLRALMEAKILQLDEKLHSVLPPLYDLLSLDPEDADYRNLEPRQKRERTFEAIRDLLIFEGQKRPLIIVVEDLHWIDRTSEEFLDYLIGWLTNAKILLVLLYRPDYTHPWGSKSYYNRIGLEQLPSKSSAELIRLILQGSEALPELQGFILERTTGNPLFIEEFTRTLLENNSIRCEKGACRLLKNISEIMVPDTIEGIIAARMDRLEDDIKRTMQMASVIGRDFPYRILEKIIEAGQELKSYLLNLQGLEFIYEKSLFPELEYVFKHALTREVAYNLKRRHFF